MCLSHGNAVLTQAVYVRVATSSEPFTTVWRVGSATGVAAGVAAYRGVDEDRPVQSSGGACQPQLRLHSDSLRPPSGRHARRGLLRPERGRRHLDAARDNSPLSRLDSRWHPVLGVDDVHAAAGMTGSLTAQPSNRSSCNIAQVVVLRSASGSGSGTPPTSPTPPPSHVSSAAAHPAAGTDAAAGWADAADAACGARDITAPSAPGNVRSTSVTRTSVAVAWNASTDNVRVTGYSSYRNGTLTGTTAGTTATFPSLSCGTRYTFGVEAYDAAGNRSSRSTVNVTTSSCSSTPPPPRRRRRRRLPHRRRRRLRLRRLLRARRCTVRAPRAAAGDDAHVHQRDVDVRPAALRATGRSRSRSWSTTRAPGEGRRLVDGCVGDGTNAIDLIVDVQGDGLTYGTRTTRSAAPPGARDLQITGSANAGRSAAAHQDGIQILGGTNITFLDLRSATTAAASHVPGRRRDRF